MGFIPAPGLLDFSSHLFHTVLNYRWEADTMDQKYIDGLRQKYIKNPPEGMTPKLVRNMTVMDLKKASILTSFNHRLFRHAR